VGRIAQVGDTGAVRVEECDGRAAQIGIAKGGTGLGELFQLEILPPVRVRQVAGAGDFAGDVGNIPGGDPRAPVGKEEESALCNLQHKRCRFRGQIKEGLADIIFLNINHR